ncbi:MAG TPA: hypothetical protein VHZ51_29980 [Ktedonobacteraceae bacterium]|jgi:hypothetical protein|nr:hypothetical protein [Ktedonobacteraceae bacterium]
MAKLQDLFTQARRTQGGGGMGFLGKNARESKAHAAALVVAFPRIASGSAEAAIKAGADGLLFTWNGKGEEQHEALKNEISAAKAANNQVITGLHITGGWNTLDREKLTQLKDLGAQYIILPFDAPVRLLALDVKELEKAVTVPVRKGEMYPLFIRNLSAFDHISAVLLDVELSSEMGALTIEQSLQYRAVREAVHFPAFVRINDDLDEAEAYTLVALGVQAVILNASDDEEKTRQNVKNVRAVLEKVHQDEQKEAPALPRP